MVTPFKVCFRQKEPGYSLGGTTEYKEMNITNYVADEADLHKLLDETTPEAVENKWLQLEFTSEDTNARLYMDGFDTIPLDYLNTDESDQVYMAASKERLLLYEDNPYNTKKGDSYYPYIPGYYRIKVISFNQTYYAWLKIKPKQVNEEQWTAMRNDVEDTLKGLAQDLIRKNASVGAEMHSPIPYDKLRKLLILKNEFSKWIIAINKIEKEPRFRVGKVYNLVHEGKKNIVDSVGVRYRSRHPESVGYIFNPQHTKNYNLPENQWLKYILSYFVKETTELSSYLKKHKLKVEKELAQKKFLSLDHIQNRSTLLVLKELEQYEIYVGRIRSNCLRVLGVEWMETVDNRQPMYIPLCMHLDMTYRQIIKLYRQIKTEDINVSLNQNYDFYWKRTSLLYEIWGFLQIIKSLQHESSGFKIISGWIYDIDASSHSFEIPFLEPGTVIKLKKDDINVHLVYDTSIPYKPEQSTLYKPLYAADKHNRPDVRLDFYHDAREDYIGSLVFDFKYRPARAIWDSAKINTSDKTDTMRQLLAYRNDFVSPFIYNKILPRYWKRVRPVHEVWAIYPRHDGNPLYSKHSYEHFQTRLMQLTPLEDNEVFHQQLTDSILEVIAVYSEFLPE
ncbi:DUF2357 domain-containing protein [Niallia sp. FSL W8-0635]|uniref:DUF2357 domain-containing protein n=1 Tax=Niallia sp. FSL W8-0635 TaxID=2975337 RepID=UPI0030FC5DCC